MNRHQVLWLLLLAPAAALAFSDPIPQDPRFHDFADQGAWMGIPNAANVLTNGPFLAVGWVGLRRGRPTVAWRVLFAAVIAVSFGSAYYHFDPHNQSLVWDRLPMTLGFMALLVALWTDHVSPRAHRALLPALAVGMASVFYWAATDDLRPYLWVQFGSLSAMGGIVGLFAHRSVIAPRLLGALLLYGLAKVAELNDAELLALTTIMAGHGLKHLLAAAGLALLAVPRRRPTRPVHPM